jgi:prepilin-type N-terminal cleavage/methylation domain-containing protein
MINKFILKNNKGFTLIELMVVISIMTVISALALFNSARLNSSVLLSNTAYEIGLIVRDAQIAGLGSRVLLSESGAATTSNQGVYFNFLEPEKIISFTDLDKNNFYSLGDPTQIYEIQNKRAGKIIKICKILNDDTCDQLIQDLNVVFKRPNPEAYFYTNEEDSTGQGYLGSVAINIGFDNEQCRSVIIYKTGAIQVDQSFCNQ